MHFRRCVLHLNLRQPRLGPRQVRGRMSKKERDEAGDDKKKLSYHAINELNAQVCEQPHARAAIITEHESLPIFTLFLLAPTSLVRFIILRLFAIDRT